MRSKLIALLMVIPLLLGACGNETKKGITPHSVVQICMDSEIKIRILDQWCDEQQKGAYWAYVVEEEGEKRELPGLNEPLDGEWLADSPKDATDVGRIPNDGAQFEGTIR